MSVPHFVRGALDTLGVEHSTLEEPVIESLSNEVKVKHLITIMSTSLFGKKKYHQA